MKTFVPVYDNDLALERNKRGRKDLVLETDQVIASIAKLYMRFQMFLGEWFLDTRIGVPWYQLILVKNPRLAVVRQVIRKVILSVPTIAEVTKLEMDFDTAARTISFEFEATAVDGRRIAGGSGVPFIIDGKEITYSEGT